LQVVDFLLHIVIEAAKKIHVEPALETVLLHQGFVIRCARERQLERTAMLERQVPAGHLGSLIWKA
jgi:hypothetical protein